MLRLALTAYLSVMTLLAPCLCCCTVSAALASLAPEEESTGASRHHGCSCGHAKPDTAAIPSEKPELPCDDHPCSAKQHSVMPVVLSSESDDVTLLHLANAEYQSQALMIHSATPMVFIVPVALDGNCSFPRLSGRGILRAVQILRC